MNACIQSGSKKILCECNEQRDEAKRNRAEREERPEEKCSKHVELEETDECLHSCVCLLYGERR